MAIQRLCSRPMQGSHKWQYTRCAQRMQVGLTLPGRGHQQMQPTHAHVGI